MVNSDCKLAVGGCLAQITLGWTYHYSNKSMSWDKARQFCKTNFTDMVVIQSQEENNYLVKLLPDRDRSPYFWIGITKKQKNETWTWVGNNSTWIGNQSWAENEPNNDHSNEFCVEIYTNQGKNRGKWNDEKCANPKFAACYKAQCNATICGRGRCHETIENITCICEPGFVGDRCETGKKGVTTLILIFYFYFFRLHHKSSVKLSKESEVPFFILAHIICKLYLKTTPFSNTSVCAAVECPPLSEPDNGELICPGGNQRFNSTCQFKCSFGLLMIGSADITCGINGVWSGQRPVCASNCYFQIFTFNLKKKGKSCLKLILVLL
uniref:Selectin E n=1 Tax=Sphaeramia orbicularis TaxID=375764 RepID=A0A673A2G6_9TELE